MCRLALLVLLAVLAGCSTTDSADSSAFDPGSLRISGSYPHRTQVMRDVAAMVEGMEGARLSQMPRAGP